MLLESRLDADTTLFIDVEPTPGFAKDEGTLGFHPDQILDNVVKVSTLVAQMLASAGAATQGETAAAPTLVSLEFGIKVDGNAVVSLAARPDWAHFRIKTEWSPAR